MEPFDLLDDSAVAALRNVQALRARLEAVAGGDPRLDDCHEQMHELVADIVAVRNAVEMLRRDLPT